MSRSRPTLRLAAAAGLLLLAAGTGAAAAASPPTLGGTVVLTGNRTVSVEVVVPRTATLGDPLLLDSAARAVSVSGGKGFTGFALRSADGKTSFIGGRLIGPVAHRTFVHATGERTRQLADGYEVPAGRYRLYLLTGGGTTTVTLRLGRLTGSTRLSPKAPRALTVARPAPELAGPDPAQVVYSVGAEQTLSGQTLAFQLLYHVHDVHTESDYWSCHYQGEPAPTLAYSPGCLGGEAIGSHVLISDEGLGRQVRYLMDSIQPLGTGRHGQGVWLVTGAPALEIGYLQLWLTY
jgi:hypothetical protein